MGGWMLWLPGDVLRPVGELVKKAARQDLDLEDVEKIMSPIYAQYALSEQAYIIQQLLRSGMTEKEVAGRLGRDISYIKEIAGMELKNDYDFSYIDGAKPYSR